MRWFLIVLLFPLRVLCQDLTGVWTGALQTDGTDLPFEILINNDGGVLTGYSLTIFNIGGIENVGIKAIRLKDRNGSIFIEDAKLIYNNYVSTSRRVKLIGEMLMRVKDTIMTLNGPFRTRSLDFREKDNPSFTGMITLQKLNVPRETKLISTLGEMNLMNTVAFMQHEKAQTIPPKVDNLKMKKVTPAPPPPPPPPPVVIAPEKKVPQPDTVQAAAELASRKTEVIQNVFFRSDSLILKLYDHGVIDGDTVSVVLNDKVIIARQRLMGKPLETVIHMTPELGDSLLVVMYAENLGSIPPNTGLLVVQDGDNRYEIRFEGTKQKSSAILLTRKRK